MTPTVVVPALRGSGGAYTHFAEVLPRLRALLPKWTFEVYAPGEVFRQAFGGDGASWMHPVECGDYAARLKWEFFELPNICRRPDPVLIYSAFGPLMNISLGPKTIWSARNIIPLLDENTWEISDDDRARIRLLRLLFVTNARAAKGVICVSNHARARLVKLAQIAETRVDVIPHGVTPAAADVICTTPALEAIRRQRYVLHLAQPVPYRRTRETILAYQQLAASEKTAPPLVLAGKARHEDAAYEAECLRLIDPLVKAGRAIVLGQVSHRDAVALSASTELFLYPSVHEDCPNAVLEGLSAGRVCVFADIPATRELANDAALYVANPTPSAIAEAAKRALGDQDLRGRLRARALSRAAIFTWDLTAQRTARALDRNWAELSTGVHPYEMARALSRRVNAS
jgi:glycosyltransferase involved in cell wall biosynthesis